MQGNVITHLGYLPNTNIDPSGESSAVWGVSNDGTVAVGTSTSTDRSQPFGEPEAAIFKDDSVTGFGNPVPGALLIESRDISADGTVAIGFGGGPTQNPYGFPPAIDSYLYSSGELTLLGHLPGSTTTLANAVSADGTVVVGKSGSLGFIYRDGFITSVGDLAGGNISSVASNISSDGTTVVGWSSSADGNEAFVHRNGTMTKLQDLAGGEVRSVALAASGDGSVIVGRGNIVAPPPFAFDFPVEGDEAVLWQEASDGSFSVNRLIDILLSQGVDAVAEGWSSLLEIRDISDDGTQLIGEGLRDGSYAYFAVSLDTTEVPIPAAVYLFCSSLLALQTMRRLRRKPKSDNCFG